MRSTKLIITAAAVTALGAGTASATTGGANAVDTSYATAQPEEDDEFPWGLLGLLGLAGLIPRKRHDHVHVDRTGTGTGTGPRP